MSRAMRIVFVTTYTANTVFNIRKRIPSKFKVFLPIIRVNKSGTAENTRAVNVTKLQGIIDVFLLVGIKAFPSASIKKARIKRDR